MSSLLLRVSCLWQVFSNCLPQAPDQVFRYYQRQCQSVKLQEHIRSRFNFFSPEALTNSEASKIIFFFFKSMPLLFLITTMYVYKNSVFLKGRKLKRKKQKVSSLELSSKPQPDFLGSDSVFSWEQLNRTWIWVWLLAGPPSPPTGVWVWWKVKRIWNSIQLILIFKNKTQKPVLQNTRSIFTSTCNNILN